MPKSKQIFVCVCMRDLNLVCLPSQRNQTMLWHSKWITQSVSSTLRCRRSFYVQCCLNTIATDESNKSPPALPKIRTEHLDENQPPQQSYLRSILSNRTLLSVAGIDAVEFLQGLITNDVRLLADHSSNIHHATPGFSLDGRRRCLYSFLLNPNGRVVADLFVYRHQDDGGLILELDSSVADLVTGLLKRYRLRRKVTISTLSTHQVSVIYPDSGTLLLPSDIEQRISLEDGKDGNIYLDPRGHRFSIRILHSRTGPQTTSLVDPENYRLYRHRQGLAEGCLDLTPLEHPVLPFEVNGDWLNALSFTKGCYIGQELTARSFHLGVIRKRLMPIQLDIEADQSLPVQTVVDDKGKNVGRFRVNTGRQGLAVLKFGEIFTGDSTTTELQLKEDNVKICVWKPAWWPKLS